MDAGGQVAGAQAPDEALRRSAAYRFLSLALLPGGDDSGAPLHTVADALGDFRAVTSDGHGVPQEMIENVAQRLRHLSDAALAEEYYRTFGHQISKDCPLYETQYGAGHVFQQAQELADIAGFYRAFGLEVAESAGERPDHIGLELEFMHVLTYREAYARLHHGPDQVAQLREAQHAFLRDHLSRWVPVLARLVRRRTDGIYRHLADLAAAWVAADAAALNLHAIDEVEYRPEPSLDPAESLPTCGVTLDSALPS